MMKHYTNTGTIRTIQRCKELDVGLLIVSPKWRDPDRWPYYAIDNGAYADWRAGKAFDGRAAISSYDSPLYNFLYDGWQKHVAPVNRNAEDHAPRQEVVWTNYDVATGERLEIRPQVKQISLNEWGVSV